MLHYLLADIINPQQGQENREPLPNPWNGGSGGGGGGGGSGGNSESRTSAGGTTGTQGRTTGGIFNSPSMQSLMQQMMENPQMIQNMLAAPYTQAMLQALTADPAMASNVLGSNPFLASNPELQVHFIIIFS